MSATAERSIVIRDVLVVQTYVVHRRAREFHYEIHLAPDTDAGARRTVLVTRDESAYEFALLLEGKDARVTASWHHARQGSYRFQVLDTLEVSA